MDSLHSIYYKSADFGRRFFKKFLANAPIKSARRRPAFAAEPMRGGDNGV